MSRIRRTFTRAVTYSIMMSTALADVVTLKSGEKVEGKILKDKVTDQKVTVEIKVGGGIFDERVIPRADIDHIDMVTPEMEAYKAVIAIQPSTNSLTGSQYEPSIRALEAYLKQYPDGGHTKEVQATLAEFKAEQKRVESGEVKLHGEWISKEKAAQEKMQIEGLLTYEYMKGLAAGGDDIGALNAFVALEKNAPGASVMPDAVELAKQLIAAVKTTVDRAIPEQKQIQAEKQRGIADSGPGERPEMIAAFKAELAQAEASASAADKAGQWPPFFRVSDKALAILQAHVAKESTRLAGLSVEGMRKSLDLTTVAGKKLEARDFDGANATLKEATTLWPANDLAKRLTADVAAQKAAVGKAPVATPVPAATPATPTPKPKSTPAKTSTPHNTTSAAAPAADDSPSFFMTLPGAITVVVTIAAALIGVNVVKKMKAKKSSADMEIR